VEPYATRRDLLLTSLLAALPFRPTGGAASPLNPAQTIIKLPDALQWETQPSFPQGSADICRLTGDSTALALQLPILGTSESMGHHDSEIMDDRGIDRDDA
jgi:hypothetical protein